MKQLCPSGGGQAEVQTEDVLRITCLGAARSSKSHLLSLLKPSWFQDEFCESSLLAATSLTTLLICKSQFPSWNAESHFPFPDQTLTGADRAGLRVCSLPSPVLPRTWLLFQARLPGQRVGALGRPTWGGESPGGRQEAGARLITADSGSPWDLDVLWKVVPC